VDHSGHLRSRVGSSTAAPEISGIRKVQRWATSWACRRSKRLLAHTAAAAAAAAAVGRAIDERTRARHAAVHQLLGQGVGLLDCVRRLGWALNTVKCHARAATAEQLQRPPRYGRTMVDPYREHLRQRLAAEPNVAVTRKCRRGL
jgi:hypothetical protein